MEIQEPLFEQNLELDLESHFEPLKDGRKSTA